MINQEIKDALSANLSKEKLRELVYKSDVVTLLQDGLEKAVNGETTIEEVLKLIELDNDERYGSTSEYDLKTAIDFTNISHNEQSNDDDLYS